MAWNKIARGLAAAAIVCGGGCAVGPDYRSPAVQSPARWSSPRTNGLTDLVSPAATWWNSFNDAELDSLIQRAVRSNPDLRVAEARLRQARARTRTIITRRGQLETAIGFEGV